MPISKAAGNMYDWITHTHSHLRGACPHACPYCYVQTIDHRFRSTHHQGPVRLADAELAADYASDRILCEARAAGHDTPIHFIEHTNDLFARGVRDEYRHEILRHTRQAPACNFVFQTKDPMVMQGWIPHMPPRVILGITIESDTLHVGNTPDPLERGRHFLALPSPRFITIEPVLRFSPWFAAWIAGLRPDFVNIGADSKHTPGLPEPTAAELRRLLDTLTAAGIQIRTKRNLARLLKA